MTITRAQRVRGSLFGAAFGDAAGRPTEFQTMRTINRDRLGLCLPDPGLVTDDTEMMLAVGWALSSGRYEPDHATDALIEMFLEWYHHPQEGRAPGATCMDAVGLLARGRATAASGWQWASQVQSKGCGANMRVQPVAYLRASASTRAGLAQLQAAITHGHPTALAAADLTQQAIHLVLRGTPPSQLLDQLYGYAWTERTTYREAWLGDLNVYAGLTGKHYPRRWIMSGWNDCIRALERVRLAPPRLDAQDDPCRFTGAGWVAEEALATALYSFLLFPHDARSAVERAARTGGDSDSIACLAGALAGAYHGDEGWPSGWYERIEYRTELDGLAEIFA